VRLLGLLVVARIDGRPTYLQHGEGRHEDADEGGSEERLVDDKHRDDFLDALELHAGREEVVPA
jgi:hypothetical protein